MGEYMSFLLCGLFQFWKSITSRWLTQDYCFTIVVHIPGHCPPLSTCARLANCTLCRSHVVYCLFTLRESLWRCTLFNHHNGCIMFALSSLKPYPLNPKPFCTFLMTCLPVSFICPCDHVHHLAQPCSEFNPNHFWGTMMSPSHWCNNFDGYSLH
jgi:hypothetical protein